MCILCVNVYRSHFRILGGTEYAAGRKKKCVYIGGCSLYIHYMYKS